MQAGEAERREFEARVEAAVPHLTPAEARLARFFAARKEAVVLGSAAQIAGAAGTSDATVVRTARALGYDSLSALREDLLAELTGTPSPARRLSRTLEAAGAAPAELLAHVADLQDATLDALRSPVMAAALAQALDLLAPARMRQVFGIGPSGAVASYAALQMNRIGCPAQAVVATGVGLADALMGLAPGDAVLLLAYAPLYREVLHLLDRAAALDLPVILISDTLGPLVEGRVACVLPMPRGRAGHLATHAGTMALIEALTLGLAARDRSAAIEALDRFSLMRGRIDRDWVKRGTRKPPEPGPAPGLAEPAKEDIR